VHGKIISSSFFAEIWEMIRTMVLVIIPEIPAFNSIFISGNDTPSRERTSMAAWLSRGLTTKLGLVGFSFGIAC